MDSRYAVIVAAGAGTRMGGDVPKQFQLLQARPVLMHTLEKFASCHCIVVLPASQIAYWEQLCQKYAFSQPHQVVEGGDSRSASVQNGLQYVPDSAYVAVHDGVRPLLSTSLVEKCFATAEAYGSAVPAVACVDSLRYQNKAVNRAEYQLVQTPQTFQASLLKQAYAQSASQVETDDATVFEKAGFAVHLVEGERNNIKLTQPFDLQWAEWYISHTM